MLSNFLNNLTYKKELFFFFFLYVTLIISFFLGENSTGGAAIDYPANKITIQAFASEFLKTFYGWEAASTRHSPVLYIFLSLLERINLPDFLIRLIHLHLCLLLPFLFYKCLTVKFNQVDKKILLFLSCLIFLSPTFRTLAIWPDSRLLGLTLFTLSIYYFLKFEVNKNFKFAIYNIITLALSAYISPNFSVFSIFFFTRFILHYSVFSKKILSIIILNLFLALPAFYYIFILDINFFLRPVSPAIEENNRVIFGNLFNDILITFSIILFYIIPFLFFKIIKINNVLNTRNVLISIFIFSICVFNFDYNVSYSGGGIFFKMSNYVFDNNYLFYLISLFSIPIVLSLISKNNLNILLFLIIIFNNPQYTIYHKYFDPFLLITFFTIFSFNIDLKKIFSEKNYPFIFAYFLAFLVISNLRLIYV